jgi:hypothetical protein
MASSLLVSFYVDVLEHRILEIFEAHDLQEFVEPAGKWTPHYRGLKGVVTRYFVEVPFGEAKKFSEIFANLAEVSSVFIEESDRPKRTYGGKNMDNSIKKTPKRR